MQIGYTFTETMWGHISPDTAGDYQAAEQQGIAEHQPCEFTLTVTSDNLDAMLTEETHAAILTGTVTIPLLAAAPLKVIRGEFNLFVRDPADVETRLMRYRMLLAGPDGSSLWFQGVKIIHDDGVLDIWRDTTTLYVDIFKGETAEAPLLARGVLHILPADFLHQLTTMRATNAPTAVAALEAQGRFGRFFAGILWQTYGDVLAKETVFDPDAPPRKKRPLRMSAPEVHFFTTADGTVLRLTRYQGGAKGPVVLVHGLGVSSLIFSIDTIETNLAEYLFAAGFDVWLFDFRASIDLPASATKFTADQVATLDYPAAVKTVREKTGAAAVQMVVHCYGATTFTMAMCAGLEGVRSAVISQISAHIIPPLLNRIRTGLHLPDFLDKIGVKSLDAYVDTHADWENRLYDKALALYPVGEACQNPVCHRITFMYAPLYQHEQLNEATHEALHEMFGRANIRAFEGLGLMTRRGHVVAADGAESYLPHLDRMAIPIAFVHGEQNQCFLPESTLVTYNALRQINRPELYTRTVIPGYGHIDCIYGKNAAQDVYPTILAHLEKTL